MVGATLLTANSVYSLPPLWGRVGVGGTTNSVLAATPTLSLPTKRGRGRCGAYLRNLGTEFAGKQ